MDYIEKLFKQYPFIYCLNGKYYAFGTGVCSAYEGNMFSIEIRYRNFVKSVDQNLSVGEAWKIFHALICRAEGMKDKKGICVCPEKEFLNLHLEEKEIDELKQQIERYVDYWKKHELHKFLR